MNRVQVGEGHYVDDVYDRKPRFASYWHQINEVRESEPRSVLEVGVGNGLVCDYLRRVGIQIETLDIDPRLEPDIVGTVLSIPTVDQAYDTVVCCQVLEHLPFSEFPTALDELARVARTRVIISLPDVNRVCSINGLVPGFGSFQLSVPIPRLRPLVHKFDGEHYWEIGKAGYSTKRVARALRKAGMKLIKTYRVAEHPYHRFFILSAR